MNFLKHPKSPKKIEKSTPKAKENSNYKSDGVLREKKMALSWKKKLKCKKKSTKKNRLENLNVYEKNT